MFKIIDLRDYNTPCLITSADVDYKVFAFPDGEKQIQFLETLTPTSPYLVKTRITSADELFILMQTADILNRNNVEWSLYITYLMTMRMDRVMDDNRPFSLKIVADIIRNLGAKDIQIVEPHSDVSTTLIGATSIRGVWYEQAVASVENPIICYPDKGACKRYADIFLPHNCSTIQFEKVRDLNTGKITGLVCENIQTVRGKNVVVIDDLVDGGATAVSIVEQLRKNGADQIVFVCAHAVNEVGLQRISSAFDHVYITDSYKAWNEKEYPNITVYPAL